MEGPMGCPENRSQFEAEHRFVDSLNEQDTSNVSDEIDADYNQTGVTVNSYIPPFDVAPDENDITPHFDIAATPNPHFKRRSPRAVAAALRRRLSRTKTGATVATYTTTDCDDDVTIRNLGNSTALDSEFGTGFLKVESVPESGSISEGCVEAEAILHTSEVTPSQHHGMDRSSSSVGSSASGHTNTNTSNFSRLVSRARQYFRPLSEARSNYSLRRSSSRGWTKPPEGIRIEEFTLNGERTFVFCRDPSKVDLNEDYQLMKERFPDVPKYTGNPPWVTKFHPDLVKPPSRLV